MQCAELLKLPKNLNGFFEKKALVKALSLRWHQKNNQKSSLHTRKAQKWPLKVKNLAQNTIFPRENLIFHWRNLKPVWKFDESSNKSSSKQQNSTVYLFLSPLHFRARKLFSECVSVFSIQHCTSEVWKLSENFRNIFWYNRWRA